MRAFLVSDNHDTLVLLRLAGITGVIAQGMDATRSAVQQALSMRDLGILVMTEKAVAAVPDIAQELRESGRLPLLVEIPDRHGSVRGNDALTRYITNAIGVKLG